MTALYWAGFIFGLGGVILSVIDCCLYSTRYRYSDKAFRRLMLAFFGGLSCVLIALYCGHHLP